MKIPSAQPDNHIHIITVRDKITFSLTIGRYTEFHYSISKEILTLDYNPFLTFS